MKLKEFREKYPEYEDIGDDEVIGFLHSQYYDDMPKEEFSEILSETSGISDLFNQLNTALKSVKGMKEKPPKDRSLEMTRILSQIRDNVNQTDNAGICNAIYTLIATIQEENNRIAASDSSKTMLEVLSQIKNKLNAVETAIKAIDVVPPTIPAPVVNIPAPVVNIPAPIVNVPKASTVAPIVNIPEPLKEWIFDVKRDRNGFISEIVARA